MKRHREMAAHRPPILAMTLLSASVIAIALCFAVAISAAEKPEPGIEIVDSPIPPGKPQMKPGGSENPEPGGKAFPDVMGYCVSTVIADVPVRVQVPFHRPEPGKVEEFRVSVKNALLLAANQAEARANMDADPQSRGRRLGEVYRFKGRVAVGVSFPGIDLEAQRKMIGGNGVDCICTQYHNDPTVVSGGWCGGPCAEPFCMTCG